MEKKYAVIIIIITLVSLIFSLFTTDNAITKTLDFANVEDKVNNSFYEIKDDYYISRYGKISIEKWEQANLLNSGYNDAEEFLTTVDYYVEKISEYLNMSDWIEQHKLKYRKDYYFEPVIEFSFINNDERLSYAEHYLKLRIKINIDDFESNFTTLSREITHIITGESVSPSLSEGLSFYIQDELGLNVNRFNYGIDIFTCSKDYIGEDYKTTIDRIGTTYGNVTIENRTAFYILSNSFCRYLINQYGIDKFMAVYKSDYIETAYHEILNASLEKIKEEWIEYIENYDNYIQLSKSYAADKNKKIIKLVGTYDNIDKAGGSIKNKTFFILNKSFYTYLVNTFGVEKYNELIDTGCDYQKVYGNSLTDMRNMWLDYIRVIE